MGKQIAYLEGEFVALEDAKISIMTHAFLYGTAIFEGIRAYFNKEQDQLYVFRLLEHYVRFKNNCRLLKMQFAQTAEQLSALTVQLLGKCDYREDVYIRPVAYKSSQ